MAYFDSPKRRAIWEKELTGLRREKERRMREGYVPHAAETEMDAKGSEAPGRRRITLAELERQISAGSGTRRISRAARKESIETTHSRTPSKGGRA